MSPAFYYPLFLHIKSFFMWKFKYKSLRSLQFYSEQFVPKTPKMPVWNKDATSLNLGMLLGDQHYETLSNKDGRWSNIWTPSWRISKNNKPQNHCRKCGQSLAPGEVCLGETTSVEAGDRVWGKGVSEWCLCDGSYPGYCSGLLFARLFDDLTRSWPTYWTDCGQDAMWASPKPAASPDLFINHRTGPKHALLCDLGLRLGEINVSALEVLGSQLGFQCKSLVLPARRRLPLELMCAVP